MEDTLAITAKLSILTPERQIEEAARLFGQSVRSANELFRGSTMRLANSSGKGRVLYTRKLLWHRSVIEASINREIRTVAKSLETTPEYVSSLFIPALERAVAQKRS